MSFSFPPTHRNYRTFGAPTYKANGIEYIRLSAGTDEDRDLVAQSDLDQGDELFDFRLPIALTACEERCVPQPGEELHFVLVDSRIEIRAARGVVDSTFFDPRNRSRAVGRCLIRDFQVLL